MKTLTALLLLLTIFSLPPAENFYVVKVVGEVLCNNKTLKTGDKLTEENILHFSGKEDKIYLLSPNDGYFLLSPGDQEKESKKWVVALKKAVIPQNKYYMTATRSSNNFSSFEDVYDLMGFFREKVLIVNETPFLYNTEKIPLDDKNYLLFSDLKGNKKVNLKIDNNSFSIAGDYKDETFQLTYVTSAEKKEIGTFSLTTKSRKAISEELAVFFNNQSGKNSSAVYFEQIVPYISEAYGNTNMEVIKNIIDKDLRVKVAKTNLP
ncbi:hypothetical protein [Maribellus maritimus]|uniref:hypothetical protein n=1 Tax=Maribellus maritimus TaxID=2870838 RepID=UPI001EEC116A|nr:hypothetical protein [Maribellus maritimus]MCG6186784.1 hypothetical protein [Maribellus maritimus]